MSRAVGASLAMSPRAARCDTRKRAAGGEALPAITSLALSQVFEPSGSQSRRCSRVADGFEPRGSCCRCSVASQWEAELGMALSHARPHMTLELVQRGIKEENLCRLLSLLCFSCLSYQVLSLMVRFDGFVLIHF